MHTPLAPIAAGRRTHQEGGQAARGHGCHGGQQHAGLAHQGAAPHPDCAGGGVLRAAAGQAAGMKQQHICSRNGCAAAGRWRRRALCPPACRCQPCSPSLWTAGRPTHVCLESTSTTPPPLTLYPSPHFMAAARAAQAVRLPASFCCCCIAPLSPPDRIARQFTTDALTPCDHHTCAPTSSETGCAGGGKAGSAAEFSSRLQHFKFALSQPWHVPYTPYFGAAGLGRNRAPARGCSSTPITLPAWVVMLPH